MKSSMVPKAWIVAHIIPLCEKESKVDPSNHRPISLRPIIGKIMETIIKNKLKKYMVGGLFTKEQSGFRNGRSCITQLLEVLEGLTASIDAKQDIHVDVIYIDFQKAFDTVPHKRLITKLYGYGIQGKLLNWIQNF